MITSNENLLISESSTIKEALTKIERNKYGLIFSINLNQEVTGLATDGDIRRGMLSNFSLDDSISNITNKDFFWLPKDTSREDLLKKLDHEIKVIPLLNSKRQLHSIVSRDHMPLTEKNTEWFRSKAPVRISFGGGGSDLTHYFMTERGAVLNSTISIYSHASIRARTDNAINIHSFDLNSKFKAKNLNDALIKKGDFGLLQAILKVVQPNFGFDLFLNSDFPMGSGLGGSASISVAVIGCLNMFRSNRWDNHEIAEIAFQAERLHLGISGGWQDQYAAVYGGINFMEFEAEQNIVHPLRLSNDIKLELEESLVLCDMGISHNSGNIHDDQKTSMESNKIKKMVQGNVDLTYEIRNHLLRGRLEKFGMCLNKAWMYKRQFSKKISNNSIDSLYEGAIKNGALGGKLLGAGGGGFFLFYASPNKKHELIQYLIASGYSIRQFNFETKGLQSWAAKKEVILS